MDLEPGWPCHGRLLALAERFASKLLPAFNTPTGMPYGTVNLALGGVPPNETPVTCVATVGTLILEFGALSRLTGDPRYEQAAMKALRALWTFRSSLGLVGNHINVRTGKWVGKEATIGSGVDSYFEYLFKGSILFRLPELDAMFREYRTAIRKYLKFGGWHVMATMDAGSVTSAVYQSLESFWPGVLAMAGDIEEAKELLITYHSVWRRYGFLPEMFDVPSNKPVRRQSVYPLRPEFIESVLHLYLATKDPYLLEMGVNVLTSIERDAKTPCGFATIHDVQTHTKENRMETFFLSETTTSYIVLPYPRLTWSNPATLVATARVRLRELEEVSSGESLPTDLGLHRDLGNLMNTSTSSNSLAHTILNELDVTFEEILSQSVTWTGNQNTSQEFDTWVENLWKEMSGAVLLPSTIKDNASTPPNYVPPDMHRKSAVPLMSCPIIPFHVRLNTMRDLDYRNLN
ncbi:ER degradation-enhancing alpha-mannosidase-like protein 2 [Taenia crassiceps]|uniref:alpha-1,2-Mannosidase n=1 Tax=Taenia crassiceps TaxID=6207 RepID=A0ABR4QSW3_9CEST